MERETNHYFKQVVNGAPDEALAKLGQALLALHKERQGGEDGGGDSAGRLRLAYQGLAKGLLTALRGQLNPAQQLFLISGALGDVVELTAPDGQRVSIELLPTELYVAMLEEFEHCVKLSSQLLQDAAAGKPLPASDGRASQSAGRGAAGAALLVDLPAVLLPLQRLWLLSCDELEPYDPEKSGRSISQLGRGGTVARDMGPERRELEALVPELRNCQAQLQVAARNFMERMKAERLAPVFKEIGELSRGAGDVLNASGLIYDTLASYELPECMQEGKNCSIRQMNQDLREGLDTMIGSVQKMRSMLLRGRELAYEINVATAQKRNLGYTGGGVKLSGEPLQRAVSDFTALQKAADASLVGEHRQSLLASTILIEEHLARLSDPLRECFATPWNVAASVLKIDELHPNCFPHDNRGWPQLPPIVVTPGSGISRWLDDRFLLGFIATEPSRTGASLNLSPLDQAVLKLYGQFLARGDIFNYRGERVNDSFMAEYAGEIEQKVVKKFTGADKKMTMVGQSTEKDSASREDAVKDYCDFIFSVYNGLPLPKRISHRKAAVLLKYCMVGTAEQSALLCLRLLPKEQNHQVRETMLRLAGRDRFKLVSLFENAIAGDVQVRSRFRDLRAAVQEIMGREISEELEALGLLNGRPQGAAPVAAPGSPASAGPAAPDSAAGKPPAPGEPHKYFDL